MRPTCSPRPAPRPRRAAARARGRPRGHGHAVARPVCGFSRAVNQRAAPAGGALARADCRPNIATHRHAHSHRNDPAHINQIVRLAQHLKRGGRATPRARYRLVLQVTKIAHFLLATLENYNIGRLQHWKITTSESCNMGRLKGCDIGRSGRLQHWEIGSLQQWKTGELKIVRCEDCNIGIHCIGSCNVGGVEDCNIGSSQ